MTLSSGAYLAPSALSEAMSGLLFTRLGQTTLIALDAALMIRLDLTLKKDSLDELQRLDI